jgi:hypothetical protein
MVPEPVKGKTVCVLPAQDFTFARPDFFLNCTEKQYN